MIERLTRRLTDLYRTLRYDELIVSYENGRSEHAYGTLHHDSDGTWLFDLLDGCGSDLLRRAHGTDSVVFTFDERPQIVQPAGRTIAVAHCEGVVVWDSPAQFRGQSVVELVTQRERDRRQREWYELST